MSYLPATLEPDKRLIKEFGKKIRIENGKKFEKFEERYSDYCKNDTSSYKAFVNKFPKILENIKSLGKKDLAAKKSVLSIFSTDSWTNLEQLKKAKHSATDCQGCLKDLIYKNALSKSPIKTNAYCNKAFLHDFDGKKSDNVRLHIAGTDSTNCWYQCWYGA